MWPLPRLTWGLLPRPPTEELAYILEASEATALVVQDAATLERLLPHLPVSGAERKACKLGAEAAAGREVQLGNE